MSCSHTSGLARFLGTLLVLVSATDGWLSAETQPDRRWASVIEDSFEEESGRWAPVDGDVAQQDGGGHLALTAHGLGFSETDISGFDGRSIEVCVAFEETAATALIGFHAAEADKGGFVASLSADGKLALQAFGRGEMTLLALTEAQLDPIPAATSHCFRLEWVDETLRCWAWNTSGNRPVAAQLTSTTGQQPFGEGTALLGVMEGSVSYHTATISAFVVTPDLPVFVSSFSDGFARGWAPVLAGGGTQRVEAGDLVLEGAGINASVAVDLEEREDMAVLAQVSMEAASAALVTVRARVNPYGGYLASISADGTVQLILARPNGASTVLAEAPSGIDPANGDVVLCLEASGRDFRAWAWPAGAPMPRRPTVAARDDSGHLVKGFAGLNALDGTVRFRYAEVARLLDRPRMRGIRMLPRGLRLELTWPSVPGIVYAFEYSTDQEHWTRSGLFSLGADNAETTTVIVPANMFPEEASFSLVRVTTDPGNEQVPLSIRPLSTWPRLELTWDSVPERPYQIEFSDDLSGWHSFGNVYARGRFGETTSVILPVSGRIGGPLSSASYYRLKFMPLP